ncbi:MAG: peptidoglycan DD-metalloendopeptidase family protein [Myxococcales bacterium]|nr:peptidoglycan DD-metalloendopeptidase family protein [Myxococcales bacterium]
MTRLTSDVLVALETGRLEPEITEHEQSPALSQPHSQIVIRVVDATGKNSEGSVVHLLDGSGAQGIAHTADAAGLVVFDELAQGVYQAWASTPGYVSSLTTVEAYSEEETRSPHRIELAGATKFTGHVETLGGLGLTAELALFPLGHDHAVFRGKSDSMGDFVFASLPKGEWQVVALAGEHAQSEVLRVHSVGVTAHIVVPMAPRAALAGRVANQRGEPVVGAQIRVSTAGATHKRITATSTPSLVGPRWMHPLTGRRELPIRDTRRFGARRAGARPLECGNGHCGVDLGSVRGAPVVAAADGVVVVASDDDRGKSGRYVALEHDAGFKTFYMHLDSVALNLAIGAKVAAGTQLGTLGRSGIRHSEAHLHFALSKEEAGQPHFLDPEPMLRSAVVIEMPLSSERRSMRALDLQVSATSEGARAIASECEMSNTDGEFSLRNLAAGEYVITVRHANYAPGQIKKLKLHPGQSLDDIRVVLNDGESLEGKILGPGGPIPDTWIRAYQGEGESRQRVATQGIRNDGSFRLRPLIGPIDLEIGAAGFGVIRKTIRAKDVDASGHVFELSLFNAELRGQVRSPGGEPLRAAQVQILSGPAGRGRRTTTDAYGFFHYKALPAGTYGLLIRSEKYPALKASASTKSSTEFSLSAGGSLRIELRDSHSEAALAGLRVSLRGPKGRTSTALSDAFGQVRVDALACGRWIATIDSPEYSALREGFEVSAGEEDDEPHIMRMKRGASLRGVVRDDYGERVAGAKVWLGSSEAMSDRDGMFHLQRVGTGDVVLQAAHGEARGAMPLELDPGDELVTLELNLRPEG